MNFENFKCKKALEFFIEICKIPHGSGNEKAISDFIVNFARVRNLEFFQDKYYNVIIKKAATFGFLHCEPVIFQSHIDMVCVKGENSNHDFLYDGIETILDGDFLKANDTTLGADNGAGVAIMLALLDDNSISHPPLEMVFTTDEETGLVGATNFDASILKGKKFINLDTEEEGVFCCGCAGGLRAQATIAFSKLKNHAEMAFLEINISGLKGGHSGIDINLERANACVLVARILDEVRQKFPINLCAIKGGGLDNVIPKDAVATICFNKEHLHEIISIFKKFENTLKNEFRISDDGLILSYNICGEIDFMDTTSTNKIISAILLIPNGVVAMSLDVLGLVETSNNIGVVNTYNDFVEIRCALRSSVESRKKMVLNKIKSVCEVVNGEFSYGNEYPSWEYKAASSVRDVFKNSYINLFGKEPVVNIIHAGLECGLFSEKINNIDAISVGFDVFGAHTVEEKLSLKSYENAWILILDVLKNLK